MEEVVTSAILNVDLRDNLLVLSTHAHSGAAGMGDDELAGVDSVAFDDLAASPDTAGELQRKGTNLEWYGAAVVAVTEADAAVGTASPRTLGTGAQQAAAGDHTHGTVHDAQGETLTTGATSFTLAPGVTITYSVANPADLSSVSITLLRSGAIEACGILAFSAVTGGTGTQCLLRLYIDGVLTTSSGNIDISTSAVKTVIGNRVASSGARIAKLDFLFSGVTGDPSITEIDYVFAGVNKV